MSYLFP